MGQGKVHGTDDGGVGDVFRFVHRDAPFGQTIPMQQKMGAKHPSKFPSFVYRQDGFELSYVI
jgi:hypothetical protein